MRKAIYQHLFAGLATSPGPEEAKRQFEELIRRSAALDGVTTIDRQERGQFAKRLLDLRDPRTVIRDRLMARYELGRSQVYQVIEQALKLSGF